MRSTVDRARGVAVRYHAADDRNPIRVQQRAWIMIEIDGTEHSTALEGNVECRQSGQVCEGPNVRRESMA